jgi:Asp-tRNA(Asn)/Glu-tRNA(Gln) amidotransferase A subunit family amidase
MDLTFTPAAKLAALYRSRKVSPFEVMRAVLERIDRVNPRVNAIVTLARESALREARLATSRFRRGAKLPPLFGIPVGIKDVTQTRGLRTTYGSKLFEDHVPDADALVVERLRAAGAIVLGKTNTPEFAFGPGGTPDRGQATRRRRGPTRGRRLRSRAPLGGSDPAGRHRRLVRFSARRSCRDPLVPGRRTRSPSRRSADR